jgi:hypothetical protein
VNASEEESSIISLRGYCAYAFKRMSSMTAAWEHFSDWNRINSEGVNVRRLGRMFTRRSKRSSTSCLVIYASLDTPTIQLASDSDSVLAGSLERKQSSWSSYLHNGGSGHFVDHSVLPHHSARLTDTDRHLICYQQLASCGTPPNNMISVNLKDFVLHGTFGPVS